MIRFLYVAPADMWSLYGSVAGDVEDTYLADWLVDGLLGRPVRAPGGSGSWTVSAGAGPVNFAAVFNSSAAAGATLTIGGDLSIALTQTYAGRVPLGAWGLVTPSGEDPPLTPATVSSVSLAFTGAPAAIAGQLVVGRARELERPIAPRGRRTWQPLNPRPAPEHDGNIRTYRRDKAMRRFAGSTVLTAAGLAALQAWYDSTNDGELLSVIVPDPLLNDAWAVKFDGPFSWEKQNPDVYHVSLAFVEVPRRRTRA